MGTQSAKLLRQKLQECRPAPVASDEGSWKMRPLPLAMGLAPPERPGLSSKQANRLTTAALALVVWQSLAWQLAAARTAAPPQRTRPKGGTRPKGAGLEAGALGSR